MSERELVMSESECTHNCETCGVENCGSRGKIEKLVQNKFSNIKKVIGVVSGKGGVGKSFVTSLIASRLSKLGYKVGILDGDITGPSIPKAFSIHERATGNDENLILPAVTKTGIKIISSSMLLENEDDPIIWRGSLVCSLLSQFFTDVVWGELDYLLIDMPPGTSDVTLTTFQSIPLNGIIIVSSPQDLVKIIVEKAVNMAKTMNINIYGLVENMSYVKCPKCNERIYIYGESHIDEIAGKYDLKVLGKLPIEEGTSKLVDEGNIELLDFEEVNNIVSKIIKE